MIVIYIILCIIAAVAIFMLYYSLVLLYLLFGHLGLELQV